VAGRQLAVDTGPVAHYRGCVVSTAASGALSGLVVADFSRVLAAPYATMLLADLGADVVKVERPGVGDDTRAWGPPYAGGTATYFLSVNRNKRSLALNLADPTDQATALELVRRADVLVENFRPGTMGRYGLSYDQIREVNPGVVYCSITGFGAGKGAALPGYAVVDVLTGLHAAVGILAALRARETTGEGQLVEVNLLSTLLSSLVNQSVAYTAGGVISGILGNRHPSISPYEVYPTGDHPIVIAVGNDRQFAALCRGLGVPELADDVRFVTNPDRVANVDALFEAITARLTTRPASAWFEILSPLGIPCGPVNDLAGAFDFAEGLGLDVRVPVGEGDHGVTVVANPIGLSAAPATYRLPPPALGEHTIELREWLAGLLTPTDGSLPPPHGA
jgi:crotonobetainyl-CoA:carnitine CoA-transferase CaiB-like acyl-CoA transferase